MVKQVDSANRLTSPEIPLPSIDYYGDKVDELIEAGVKLTTIRKAGPKYQGFKVGDHIVANCVDAAIAEVSVVVWGVMKDVPLESIDLALLNLDGFTSIKQAVESLRALPGYEEMTRKSLVTLIATIPLESFEWLSEEQKQALLAQRTGTTLRDVVREPELQSLVRYSIASWEWFRGGNAENWLLRFLFLNLITKKEFDSIHAFHSNLENPVFGDAYVTEFLFTQGQALMPDLFSAFVLAESQP